MDKRKIRIVVKNPQKTAEVIDIHDSVPEFRDILQGPMEYIAIPELQTFGIDLLDNEHSREMHLSGNIFHNHLGDDGFIYGPIIALSHDSEGETLSLTDIQIEMIKKWFEDHSIYTDIVRHTFHL